MAEIRLWIESFDEDFACPKSANMICKKECNETRCKQGESWTEAVERVAYALAKRKFGKNADAIQFAGARAWMECEEDARAVIYSLLEQERRREYDE